MRRNMRKILIALISGVVGTFGADQSYAASLDVLCPKEYYHEGLEIKSFNLFGLSSSSLRLNIRLSNNTTFVREISSSGGINYSDSVFFHLIMEAYERALKVNVCTSMGVVQGIELS